MAGIALGGIGVHFVWQARHLLTATFTLRGRRGTYGTGKALVAWSRCRKARTSFAEVLGRPGKS